MKVTFQVLDGLGQFPGPSAQVSWTVSRPHAGHRARVWPGSTVTHSPSKRTGLPAPSTTLKVACTVIMPVSGLTIAAGFEATIAQAVAGGGVGSEILPA